MNFDVLILYLQLILCECIRVNAMISIHLDSNHAHDKSVAIKAIKYCNGCPSAEEEGSIRKPLILLV